MKREVRYTPEAERQLVELYAYIADSGRPVDAERFVTSILDFCDGLGSFPQRGTLRDDIRPGLRTIGFRRRVLVAFVPDKSAVAVIGVFYGGRNYERIL